MSAALQPKFLLEVLKDTATIYQRNSRRPVIGGRRPDVERWDEAEALKPSPRPSVKVISSNVWLPLGTFEGGEGDPYLLVLPFLFASQDYSFSIHMLGKQKKKKKSSSAEVKVSRHSRDGGLLEKARILF